MDDDAPPWIPIVVARGHGQYRVFSESDPATTHDVDMLLHICGCRGFRFRNTCKHIVAVEKIVQREGVVWQEKT